MAFFLQSIQSFRVRITLIFFTLILLIIILFIGYYKIEKRNDNLFEVVNQLNSINYNFSKSTVNFQASLLYDYEVEDNFDKVRNDLGLYRKGLNTFKLELETIKNELTKPFINTHDDFDEIIDDLNSIQQSALNNKILDAFAIKKLFDAVNTNHSKLDDKLNSLLLRLNQEAENKNKFLQYNTTILFILMVIIVLGFTYFLAQRLTRDLRTLNLKMKNFNNFNEEPFISNIEDINRLDKTFELVKSKLRELESDLEEAIKISEYKSVFLANMSYEIRTPLNSVLGMINMLKQSDLTTEQQIQLEIAEYSSEHVLQLVSMILDNSKVEGGDIQLELTAIDLKSDLSKLVKVFEFEAWDNRLEFEFKFLADENQKFLLLGDLKRIKQILTNLLSNALKFTNSGKISLTVDQTVGPDDYQIVTFYVKDTGIGIPPDKAKRIFSDFENNHLSIMDYYGGTGLGLIASCQLINLMGGELKLESKENEGSIFYFSIQLKKTLNLERELPVSAPILKNQFDYKFSVLVAEDNIMNQKVIKFLLEQQGADCTFVKNGSDAVKLFKILDFDMVFMDIFMPEMDGYEATKLIKHTKKYSEHHIPIIAVSASAFAEDIENAKKAGIDDFLAKPIETQKLKELLVKYTPRNTNFN